MQSDDGRYTILALSREQPDSWQYMPAACARLAAFCKKYDSDADTDLLVKTYQSHFVAEDPQMLVLVLLDDAVMRGHLLVSIDTWMGCKVCSILQYEYAVDESHLPRAFLQATLEMVGAWGKAHGALHFQALVRHAALAKAFTGLYGFAPFAMILRHPL